MQTTKILKKNFLAPIPMWPINERGY